MPALSPPLHIRVFVASPNDVAEERAIACRVIDELPDDEWVRGSITTEVVAWDWAGGVPMQATMTPQEAIARGLPRPGQCEIVVAVLWSRMGTPLPTGGDLFTRPGGGRYLSGTEWEIEDARRGANGVKPVLIVYRRVQPPPFDLNDPSQAEIAEQYQRVEEYFASYVGPDGELLGGLERYSTPDEFRQRFWRHLRKVVRDLLERSPHFDVPVVALEALPDVTGFVLRDPVVEDCLARIERDRLLVITGMAGIGKTSLGAMLAHHLAADTRQVLWHTFDPLRNNTLQRMLLELSVFFAERGAPELLAQLKLLYRQRREVMSDAAASWLAPLPVDTVLDLLELVLRGVASGPYVLCFDQLEAVEEQPEIAAFFRMLALRLRGSPQATAPRVILMGRSVSDALLELPRYRLDGLDASETVDFAARNDCPLPLPVAASLVQRTAGNPLLIRLVLAPLRSLSTDVEAMLRFVDGLPGQDDVRAFAKNVVGSLSEDEIAVVEILSVFRHPATISMAEELLVDEAIPEPVEIIHRLIDYRILEMIGDSRVDCHEIVRRATYDGLPARRRNRLHRRTAQLYLESGDFLESGTHYVACRDDASALDVLADHLDQIVREGGAEALLRLLSAIRLADLDPTRREQLWHARGVALTLLGRYDEALRDFEAALAGPVEPPQAALLSRRIAHTLEQLGNYRVALERLHQSLDLTDADSEASTVAGLHHDLGWVHHRLGEHDLALQRFQEGLVIAERGHDHHLGARVRLGVGASLWKKGDLAGAEAAFEKSLRVFRDWHDDYFGAKALANLGLCRCEQGDLTAAHDFVAEALAVHEKVGDVSGQRRMLNNLAFISFKAQDYGRALEYYARLEDMASDTGNKSMQSLALAGIADVRLARNELGAAEAAARAAYDLALSSVTDLAIGVSLRVLGDMDRAAGRVEEARSHYLRAIAVLDKIGEAAESATARLGLDDLPVQDQVAASGDMPVLGQGGTTDESVQH